MKYQLKGFSRDEKYNVHVLPHRDEIDYSDGEETEARIYAGLTKAIDRSSFSKELTSLITDWPSEYHFSPLRHNLLRHVPFSSSDKVLELGCGCGAITRQLGESGAEVTAIEGSFDRAKSAAVRCEDLKNVKVYHSNFQDIDFQKEYDYVIMIGVFEYCLMYFKGDDPVAQCLDVVKAALKNSGKLIIAIENRLGLKYFAGIEEDHVGIPFFGIQDLYNRNTAVTFGKVELSNILVNHGFRSIEYQYPFPDYKLPRVIFMENAFNNPGFRPAEIIRQFTSRAYSEKTSHLFSESLVWPVLDANNLVTALSNSFLVISSFAKEADVEEKLLATLYTSNRKIEYNVKTDFIQNEHKVISVRKTPFVDNLEVNQILIHQPSDDKYYTGDHFDSDILKSIYADDFVGYVEKIREWIDFVLRDGVRKLSDDIGKSTLSYEFIDCTPINLIKVSDGLLVYIDREWSYLEDFTLSTLLLRYLDEKLHSEFIDKHLNGRGRACGKFLQHLGLTFDDTTYNDYRNVHDFISKIVFAKGIDLPVSQFSRIKFTKELRTKINALFQKIKINLFH